MSSHMTTRCERCRCGCGVPADATPPPREPGDARHAPRPDLPVLAPRPTPGPERPPGRGRRGFTLLETALTLVIISVGVLAIVESQQYFFQANGWSSHAAAGTFLANEIREMTHGYARHDPVGGLTLVDDGAGGTELIGWGPEPGEVTVQDFDDLDDFDGFTFRWDGTGATEQDGVLIIDDDDLPGPIDAFGNVIDGLDGAGGEQAAFGWAQTIFVEKVDPFDYTTTYAPADELPPAGSFDGLDVGDFPLRVTVVVTHQGPFDAEAQEVARVSWIVPVTPRTARKSG